MPSTPRFTMIRMLCAMAIMVASISLMPVAAHGAEHIRPYVPNAEKVGQGRMTYMFWDVYDAALYAPQGSWSTDNPYALKLSYLRNLDGKKIADRSAEEIRKQGFSDEVKLATWHAQMRKIFPDVTVGSSLTGVYTKNGDTVFYQNGTKIGAVKDPEFSAAFFGIWLNEKTSAPDLREQLLAHVESTP